MITGGPNQVVKRNRAVDEALYYSAVMRSFVGIDLGRKPVPDETTVCKFRHPLEGHALGGEMLETVTQHLQSQGVRITTSTIVDATIIHAPSSTKNREQKRDPEMHETKKGNQRYFGMKAHVGVDSKTKMIPTVVATAANVADATVLPAARGGDAGVGRPGVPRADRGHSPPGAQAQDCTYRLDVATTELSDILAAIDLHRLHGFSFWDGMIVRAAKQTGCRVPFSEDLQQAREIDGVAIINPFQS